jgi:hypothetical protein
MNEMDQLTQFRDAVPVGVTPRAEQLFRAGLREEHYPERTVAPRRTSLLARIRPDWRLWVIVSVAAALVAGIVVAVQPSAPVVLTARLLADRASAAALAQPAVNPGQWVYREIVLSYPHSSNTIVNSWETANDAGFYGEWSNGFSYDNTFPDYSQLGSLPRDPAALDAYLGNKAGKNAAPDIKAAAVFNDFDDMLSNFVLPPALQAEVYQALALLPGIQVDSHVTTIAGQVGVAFVQQPTPQTAKGEIILNPSTYAYLAQAVWMPQYNGALEEQAVKQMVLVAGPGSTQPSSTPPSAAELLAEQAEQAADYSPQHVYAARDAWVVRDLATSSGDQTVWATGDDSEQASYVNGKLQVCARSAACAKSVQWLMPAGPAYTTVNIRGALPSLPKLLAELNSYSMGCTDVTGDCNAVNAIANVSLGYANQINALGEWFLLPAEMPGVTVQHVTDVAGRADIAFRFPFTDGVTEILFNASTYQFTGYVRDGSETVITKEAAVSGPGSLTPACPPLSPGCAPRVPPTHRQ